MYIEILDLVVIIACWRMLQITIEQVHGLAGDLHPFAGDRQSRSYTIVLPAALAAYFPPVCGAEGSIEAITRSASSMPHGTVPASMRDLKRSPTH